MHFKINSIVKTSDSNKLYRVEQIDHQFNLVMIEEVNNKNEKVIDSRNSIVEVVQL